VISGSDANRRNFCGATFPFGLTVMISTGPRANLPQRSKSADSGHVQHRLHTDRPKRGPVARVEAVVPVSRLQVCN
jgi:hypothetical protein